MEARDEALSAPLQPELRVLPTWGGFGSSNRELLLGFPIPSIHRILNPHSQNSKIPQWFGFGRRLKPISPHHSLGTPSTSPGCSFSFAKCWIHVEIALFRWESSTGWVCVCHPSLTPFLDLKVETAGLKPIFRDRKGASFASPEGPSRTMGKGGKGGAVCKKSD